MVWSRGVNSIYLVWVIRAREPGNLNYLIVQMLATGTSVFWRLFKRRVGLKCLKNTYFPAFLK